MASLEPIDYNNKFVNGENLKELIKKLRNEIAATGGKDVYKQDVNIEENTDDLGTYHRISVTTTYKDGTIKTSRAVILPESSGSSVTSLSNAEANAAFDSTSNVLFNITNKISETKYVVDTPVNSDWIGVTGDIYNILDEISPSGADITITSINTSTNTVTFSSAISESIVLGKFKLKDYSSKYLNGEGLKSIGPRVRTLLNNLVTVVELSGTSGSLDDDSFSQLTSDKNVLIKIDNYYYRPVLQSSSTKAIFRLIGTNANGNNAEIVIKEDTGDGSTIVVGNYVWTLTETKPAGESGAAIVDAAALPTATEISPDFVRIQGKYLYVKTSYDAGTLIGFTGLTNSSGVLTLTDEAADIATYTKATNGEYVSVSSDLDNMFPYNQLEEVTDDSGNVFIKFPKMWIKWITDTNGYIDGFKCANYQVDSDFFIPDCFLSPVADGSYLDYILIGKYEGSGSSSKVYSKTSASCLVFITRANFRAGCRAYGTSSNYYNGYQQLDLSMLTLYNFLCMMYYRTANIQTVYAGRTSASAKEATGSTDSISGLNGWNTKTGCVKMLGVENPYGNIFKWVDGVYFSSETIYTHRYPTQFADSTTNGITMGFSRPTSSNYIIYLKKGTTAATKSNVYAAVTVGGTADTRVGDFCYYSSSGTGLSAGGAWDYGSRAGLWNLLGNYSASVDYSYIGGRLCCRPLN